MVERESESSSCNPTSERKYNDACIEWERRRYMHASLIDTFCRQSLIFILCFQCRQFWGKCLIEKEIRRNIFSMNIMCIQYTIESHSFILLVRNGFWRTRKA